MLGLDAGEAGDYDHAAGSFLDENVLAVTDSYLAHCRALRLIAFPVLKE